MAQTIIIDGDNIRDLSSFYEEVNRVFMMNEDWKLGESLDAFNDLLYGGFGAIKTNEPVELIWLQFDRTSQQLGLECTRGYYQSKIDDSGWFNIPWAEKKLQELEDGTGQTYFEILMEIIGDHPNITLIKK